MPRGTCLTEVEQGRILAHKENKLGLRDIGRKLNRHPSTISNFLNDPENYGTKKTGGPKKKLIDREERKILRHASNSTGSLNDIRAVCQVNVSKCTVCRVI
jgi:IS30 family transposase